jgi:hydroxymethylpyrimidine/phosphomethylpyrimidine kinase
MPEVVLTIAGFDPSSGAGITSDIKTIAAHLCYGVACITALTVQSTAGVLRSEPLDATLVRETLDELAADFELSAIHIGMLGSASVASAVADFLAGFVLRRKTVAIVLDPVFQASSGAPLLDAPGMRILQQRLLPLATVITPNLEEASSLTGFAVGNLDDMRQAAGKLHEMGARGVVVTGGHLDPAADLLSFDTSLGVQQEVFKSQRQKSNSTHGTGCAFATSIACHLAEGRGLPEAVLSAKAYVSAAISNAYPLGRGIGPLHHLYRMDQPRRSSSLSLRPTGAEHH